MNPSNPTATLRTMEQERAQFALARIQAIQSLKNAQGQEDLALQDATRRYLENLPALIHMNGLGQALAFYRSKDKTKEKNKAYHEIYSVLNDWLCGADSKGRIFGEADVLTAITRSDMQHYMAAQNEAQALLEWLKKFALALLKKN